MTFEVHSSSGYGTPGAGLGGLGNLAHESTLQVSPFALVGVRAVGFVCFRSKLLETRDSKASFSFQETDGLPIVSRHWLPKTFAQGKCSAQPWPSRRTQPASWAARPAAHCCGACPRDAPHPCSHPLRATPTRPSSRWMPRPQRYLLHFVMQPWVWGLCLQPVTSFRGICACKCN